MKIIYREGLRSSVGFRGGHQAWLLGFLVAVPLEACQHSFFLLVKALYGCQEETRGKVAHHTPAGLDHRKDMKTTPTSVALLCLLRGSTGD